MKAATLIAIETSTPVGSVAVVQGNAVLFERSFTSARNHNAKLFEPLQAALEMVGGRIDEIIVGCGPGSYNGSRVAIAAAQGVALVKGARVTGLPSYLGIEMVRAGDRVLIAGNARRGEFSLQMAEGGQLMGEPVLLAPDVFAERVRAEACANVTFDRSGELAVAGLEEGDFSQVSPTAVLLAQGWLALSKAEKEKWRGVAPEPLYLRPPHITKSKKKLF